MNIAYALAEAKALLEETGYTVLEPGQFSVLELSREEIGAAGFEDAGFCDYMIDRLAHDLGMGDGMMQQYRIDLEFWCKHYGFPRKQQDNG